MYTLIENAQKKRNKRRGFTLVELVIVIVILGILVGIGALAYSNVTKSAKEGVARANLRAWESAVRVWQFENPGVLPTADQAKNEVAQRLTKNFIADKEPKTSEYNATGGGNADLILSVSVDGGTAITLTVK